MVIDHNGIMRLKIKNNPKDRGQKVCQLCVLLCKRTTPISKNCHNNLCTNVSLITYIIFINIYHFLYIYS